MLIVGNVGGIVDGRGLAFYSGKGLYVAHSHAVSRLADSSTVTAVLSYTAEAPHDLTFDAAGNLYVVTNINVHVYDTMLTPTAAFAHGLSPTVGDGNQFKSWAIAIHPNNGEAFVGGAQGVKRFSAGGTFLGTLLGSSSGPATFLLGAAGIAFTSSGYNGALLYVGAVRSGNDFIHVFDAGLNFLRTITLAHNGNPIDMEIHPTTGELLSLNTVNDVVDRYSTTEVRTASLVSG